MKFKILLSVACMLTQFYSQAQESKTYAITGDGNNDFVWMNIRQVDINTGSVTNTVFERNKTQYSLTDANTKKLIGSSTSTFQNKNNITNNEYPTASLVAAAALDKRTNKLFFAPMRRSELRWIDLNQNDGEVKFYSISNPHISIPADPRDEGTHLTRMVIAADGQGYAISNDGNLFIQFTTGKKPEITLLGGLIDAESNKTVSIHNKCSSWGGDMVADAFGRLYVISANRHVFEIDVNSRIATHKGAISGLPANYTANAAAVDDAGNLVISSANVFAGYYRVHPKDFTATLIEGSDTKYNAADLANGNLLFQEEADAARSAGNFSSFDSPVQDSRVFPNPVSQGRFTINLAGYEAGSYKVLITDVTGKNIQANQFILTKGMQTQQIALKSKPAKGLYLLQVVDMSNNVLLTEKLMIH